ncbi:uncharacterized protein [Coffea arabica]|uniref:Uncharacterized protein isoform X1 n=2 Tax=Coffea arabica TaxID=13443 RepID=A0A6P6S598_COFAR|nr:uncharacterized protein LOC113687963 [Coffea arabica]XP_027063386.1 uncharacterized protein LOC113689801 [Coffea arabica]
MGSSSKRKSAKKKSSKLSSQARKMKKSGRTKSKKLGRRHDSSTDDSMSSDSISSPGNDSYASNSDDDSMSSASISRSSSKDSYRRRKNKSRSRGKLKKTRKRARRRSSSRDNRKKLAPMKKRKRSRKDSDSKTRKKYGRKKRRRDSSASPTSSNSHSCSTCKGGNSDSEESERESVWSRPRENKRDLSKDKRRTKLSFRRSPSHSSHSRSKDQSGSVSYSEEKFLNENNSRRLRSVITFVEQRSEGEGNEWKKDLQNEEIVYDNDDYPSRSSSGGGSKKESTPRSPIAFDVEKRTESPIFVSEHEVTELSGSVNDAHDMNEFATRSSAKENGNYTPLVGAGSGGDDLEAILRQKALQNLNKFRGGHKSNTKPTLDQKNKDDGNVNASSTSTAAVERVVLDSGHTEKVYGIVKQNNDHPADGSGLSGNPKEDGLNSGNPVVGKSVSGTSPFRGRSSGLDMRHQATASGASPDKILREIKSEGKTTATVQTTSVAGNSSFWESSSGLDTPNKTTTSVASPEKFLMETESDRKTELKITQPLSPSVGINKGSACSSATVEPALSATSGGQSLNNQKDEAKDGGQYQQKTMSVMRGGEMVQVNYKVYIPQRAPALARRQLKR